MLRVVAFVLFLALSNRPTRCVMPTKVRKRSDQEHLYGDPNALRAWKMLNPETKSSICPLQRNKS